MGLIEQKSNSLMNFDLKIRFFNIKMENDLIEFILEICPEKIERIFSFYNDEKIDKNLLKDKLHDYLFRYDIDIIIDDLKDIHITKNSCREISLRGFNFDSLTFTIDSWKLHLDNCNIKNLMINHDCIGDIHDSKIEKILKNPEL